MELSTDAAQRLSLATEIASQMSDEEWNAFVAAEKARRTFTATRLAKDTRVRFVTNTRPKRIAGATGTIIESSWSNAKGVDLPDEARRHGRDVCEHPPILARTRDRRRGAQRDPEHTQAPLPGVLSFRNFSRPDWVTDREKRNQPHDERPR